MYFDNVNDFSLDLSIGGSLASRVYMTKVINGDGLRCCLNARSCLIRRTFMLSNSLMLLCSVECSSLWKAWKASCIHFSKETRSWTS
jgi:hypothetical protein